MNRRRASICALSALALASALSGGCSYARGGASNFQIGKSTAPRASGVQQDNAALYARSNSPQRSEEPRQLIAVGDMIGEQLFLGTPLNTTTPANGTAFATVPTE